MPSRHLEERRDQLIELQLSIELGLRGQDTHIHPTSLSKLKPTATGEIAISCVDCVGVKRESASQLARTRQLPVRLLLATVDGKHDLSGQLFGDGDFAVFRDPKFH